MSRWGGEGKDKEGFTRFAVASWDAKNDKAISLSEATVIDYIWSTCIHPPHQPLFSHWCPAFLPTHSATQMSWAEPMQRGAAGLVGTGRGNTFDKIKSGRSKVKAASLPVELWIVPTRHRWPPYCAASEAPSCNTKLMCPLVDIVSMLLCCKLVSCNGTISFSVTGGYDCACLRFEHIHLLAAGSQLSHYFSC